MILCLTPNRAVDRMLYVNSLKLGEVQRAGKVLMAAGGKGLNVARTIRMLGGKPLCVGPIGDHTGDLLAELANRERLSSNWTRVRNETLTCMIFGSGKSRLDCNQRYRTGMDASEFKILLEDVLSLASRANLICICGSLPPGVSQEQFKTMLLELAAMGTQVWVDTSEDALKAALATQGICIKVNAAELGIALDMEITNVDQAVKATHLLREQGITQIAVTLGKD